MIPSTIIPPCASSLKEQQRTFLTMLPRIQSHARFAFRSWKCAHRRADAVVETVGLAWLWYVQLSQRGKDVSGFVTRLANYAAKAVRHGRRVCGQQKADDVLSPLGASRHRFLVEQLIGTALSEALVDNTVTPPPKQAAFRIDFPNWLATRSERDRQVAGQLMRGDRTVDVSRAFALTAARVSQLRRELCNDWRRFCEVDDPAAAVRQ
jgi:hypothetical protein